MIAQSCIYILGPKKFYNETMQYVVRQDMNMPCELLWQVNINELTGKFQACAQNGDCFLCLFDYQEELFNEICFKIDLNLNRQNKKLCYCRVLYNAPRNTGIEMQALTNGIKGIFYEDDSKELIKKGIKTILNGELWFSRQVLSEFVLSHENKISNQSGSQEVYLTCREKEILLMVGQGKSNLEIAKELCITTSTVKTHVYKIFQKIEVPNRIQAALWTMENICMQ